MSVPGPPSAQRGASATQSAPQQTQRAQQTRGNQTVAAQRPSAVSRARTRASGISTPTMLRLLRTLIVVAIAVATTISAVTLSAASRDLDRVAAGTAQLLAVEGIKSEVLRADGLATNGLAQGASETEAQRAEYRNHLVQAARLTVEASSADATDVDALANVNGLLLRYASSIDLARSAAGQPETIATLLAQSDALLSDQLVPALDDLIAAHQADLDVARSMSMLATTLSAIVPLLLLLVAIFLVARRTRRIINLGLAIAVIIAVASWQLVWQVTSATTSMVATTRANQLQSAIAASHTLTNVSVAKSVEGRQFVQPAKVDELQSVWQRSMAAASAQLANIQGSQATHSNNMTAYSDAHAAVLPVIRSGDAAAIAAAAGSTASNGVNPTYTTLVDGLANTSQTTRDNARTQLGNQSTQLVQYSFLVSALGLLGLIAAAYGLSVRLREYR